MRGQVSWARQHQPTKQSDNEISMRNGFVDKGSMTYHDTASDPAVLSQLQCHRPLPLVHLHLLNLRIFSYLYLLSSGLRNRP